MYMSKTRQLDDLTVEEIKDIKEFRNADDGKRQTLSELLEDLNK